MQNAGTNVVYLLTGGNLGDRKEYLLLAKQQIQYRCGNVTAFSPVFETEAWGTEAPPYLNQALQVQTSLSPQDLLKEILAIEKDLGRLRQHKYSSRTLDIDILFYEDEIIAEPNLVVPHAQLQNRRFALQCLNAIAPKLIHPLLKKTVAELLRDCKDKLWTRPFVG